MLRISLLGLDSRVSLVTRRMATTGLLDGVALGDFTVSFSFSFLVYFSSFTGRGKGKGWMGTCPQSSRPGPGLMIHLTI